MAKVQLYGSFSDYLSFANVSKAVGRALTRNHVDFSVYDISTDRANYADAKFPIAIDSHASIGICVAYPPPGIGWLKGHDYRILMTVCESDRVPREWVSFCRLVDLVVVPSEWCKAAYIRSGVPANKLMVVHHGTDERYWKNPQQYWERPHEDHTTDIQLLHVSGALSFPQRKGTPQLLLAFKKLCKDVNNVNLYLKIPKIDKIALAVDQLGLSDHVSFWPNAPYRPFEMHHMLRTFVDMVVQPSRGEGFGLLPVEARCIGVPVMITTATGHAEHYVKDVDVMVSTGDLEPLSTQGNQTGQCPTLSANDLYDSLLNAISNIKIHKERTRTWAKDNWHRWTWPTVLRPLMDLIAPIASKPIGAIAGSEASLRGM